MEHVERFGVSMSPSLLTAFDEAIEKAGYANRSAAIRDMVRDYLVRQEWEASDVEVVGTITLVYDHHTPDLETRLTGLQHHHCGAIICSSHVHLDEHNCVEAVILRGTGTEVRRIADLLLSTRGVKHGGLTATTTGQDL